MKHGSTYGYEKGLFKIFKQVWDSIETSKDTAELDYEFVVNSIGKIKK